MRVGMRERANGRIVTGRGSIGQRHGVRPRSPLTRRVPSRNSEPWRRPRPRQSCSRIRNRTLTERLRLRDPSPVLNGCETGHRRLLSGICRIHHGGANW